MLLGQIDCTLLTGVVSCAGYRMWFMGSEISKVGNYGYTLIDTMTKKVYTHNIFIPQTQTYVYICTNDVHIHTLEHKQ